MYYFAYLKLFWTNLAITDLYSYIFMQRFIHFEFIPGSSDKSKEISNDQAFVRRENNRATAPLQLDCEESDQVDLRPTITRSSSRIIFESDPSTFRPPDVEISYGLDITINSGSR